MNKTNKTWQKLLKEINNNYDYEASPRDMLVREKLSAQYVLQMPAYLSVKERKINLPFMFSEAAWILSGSNRASEVSKYMKVYYNFSDDGIFLRGAYGPKIIDQLGYVVDSLEKDKDSRQAVINIWRERPAQTKDMPCTISMQFLIRQNKLHMVTTMRSQDIVLGFTYDIFTFSMVAKAVQLLLRTRDVNVSLGNLYVTAGSLHLYERHFDIDEWIESEEEDKRVKSFVSLIDEVQTYEALIEKLNELARKAV